MGARVDLNVARRVSFSLSLLPTDFVLSVDEIWPDGDAPDNPTAADVVEQMQKTTGSAQSVIREWGLDPEEIEVLGNHDASKAIHR